MFEGALITALDNSAAIAIIVLAGLIRQLSTRVASMDKSLDDVKKGVVWQDEFGQFEDRFKTLEGRTNKHLNGGGK